MKSNVSRGPERRRNYILPGAAGLIAAAALCLGMTASPGVVVNDLNHGVTPTDLATTLIGGGVTISNVTFTGDPRAGGKFSGGTGILGFESGIVLGSGKVQTVAGDPPCSRGVEGPNSCHELGGPDGNQNSTPFGTPGDVDLTGLSGNPTFDAAVLEFDFVPQFSTIQVQYVFGSDEYSDFSNTPFNDVFAFFVNGTNCALVPGTAEPVSINTINNGNDVGGDPTPHHPELFRDNVNPSPSIDAQSDGLTVVLTCNASVNQGQTNHMKLAVADASDSVYDTQVFIKATSFVSGTLILSPAHLWIGLRNSDDQGTQFDLKAEVLQNGNPIASGLTRCITGVTRNPTFAKEAVVPFDPFPPPSLMPGDVLSLRVSTRIGTKPDDTKCPGPGGSHNNARGLRLYYDSASRPSRFDATIPPSPNEDLYLHSDGGPCPGGDGDSPGVTTRFLSSVVPVGASPRCKDSTPVNFAGGNPYSLIGTWDLPPLP